MMKMYAMGNGADPVQMPVESTLIVNTANAAAKKLYDDPAGEKAERAARQIYSLALMSQRLLTPLEMKTFTKDVLDSLF